MRPAWRRFAPTGVSFALFVAGAALAGCESVVLRPGSAEASSAGPGTGGGAQGAGGGSGVDGAGGAQPTRFGEVRIANVVEAGAAPEQGGVVALFEDVIDEVPECVRTEIGPCVHLTCEDAHAGSWTPYADAGAMTIRGASGPILDPTRDADGVYASWIDGLVFAPGDSMHVQFSGATVPAFDVSIAAPSRFVDVVPAPESLATLSRATPIDLTWGLEGTPQGTFMVQIAPFVTVTGDGVGYQSLACVAPLGDRAISIPAEALALLEDRDPLSVRLWGRCSTEVVVDDWRVFVEASQLVVVETVLQ